MNWLKRSLKKKFKKRTSDDSLRTESNIHMIYKEIKWTQILTIKILQGPWENIWDLNI